MGSEHVRPDRDIRRQQFKPRNVVDRDINGAGGISCPADHDPRARAERLARQEQRIRAELEREAARQRYRRHGADETDEEVEALLAAAERDAERAARREERKRRRAAGNAS